MSEREREREGKQKREREGWMLFERITAERLT